LSTDPHLNASGKIFAILDAFSRGHPALSLSELSRACALPLSTVHRLVAELVTWGGLERDLDGRYRVGLRMWEIGALAPRGPGLREAALPFMEDLYEATHGNVRLAVRQETNVMFVEHIAGHTAVRLRTTVGVRLPMPATGGGLVLLAHSTAEFVDQVLARPLPRFTPYTVTSPVQVRRMVDDVRKNGFAVSDRQMTIEAVSVAAPVRSPSGETIAALSVAIRRQGRPTIQDLVPRVMSAARGVSRALAAKRV
jgi:DNA-binding IclR family transcriptional regulator